VRAALAFVLISSVAIALRVSAQPPPADPRQSAFSLYAHAFLDSTRQSTVAVNVAVPYSSLIFLKKGAAFQAEYVAYVKILDAKNRLVDSAVLNEAVAADDYEETRSARSSAKSSRRFHLEKGDYEVECVVEVKNTIRVFEKTVAVTVPDFPRAGLAVGTPRLHAVAVDTTGLVPVWFERRSPAALQEEELEGTLFAELDRRPMLSFEIFEQEETRDSIDCVLYFEVADDRKTVHAYGRQAARIGGLRTDFAVYLDVDDWDPGTYVFTVKAVHDDPPRETRMSFEFTVGCTRAMLTRQFEKTIGILSLIATPQEIDAMRSAAESERGRLWTAFWMRRDPSPGTGQNEALVEHLRRVRHATETLGDGGVGWESDRGKVYIKYGEPEHTEIKIDAQNSGEYLIWYYYKESKTFVFYDRMGLGEYRLTDSSRI
jgi:GWxTD domain-containing protein